MTGYNVDVGFQIFLYNQQGQNLLDPNINESYDHSEINLYYDSSLSDKTNDPFIYQSSIDDAFFLDLFGGGAKEKKIGDDRIKYGTKYLQLNDSTVDTIYSESIYKGESLLLNKVVYNSEEVFNIGDSRAITITK